MGYWKDLYTQHLLSEYDSIEEFFYDLFEKDTISYVEYFTGEKENPEKKETIYITTDEYERLEADEKKRYKTCRKLHNGKQVKMFRLLS